MKKFIIATIMLFAFGIQSIHSQSYKLNGTTFTQVSNSNKGGKAIQTKYTWEDSKGNKYPIFLSSTGRAFVNKMSGKTGNEYKYYLDNEIGRKLSKEYNITYVEPKNKK